MKKDIVKAFIFVTSFLSLFTYPCFAQAKWTNVDSAYQPLPKGFHIYKTTDSLDGAPNIAYYAVADLKSKKLSFTVDTTFKRRLTPTRFFEKNNNPLLVVNGTFFSFETNQNLNLVVKNGKIVSHNVRKIKSKTGDTSVYKDEPVVKGVLGISKKRKADIGWISSDSNSRYATEWQQPISAGAKKKSWKMKTAIGGGPMLIQNGKIFITNNEEKMFAGKGILDKHPRTCIGYTKNKLIIMVIQGRFPTLAEGATLQHEAQMLLDLGCIEGLNLDGGGSSCMLVNGKPTITPSDKGIQRAVPAVFIIK
ncbi:MAG: phosphodiester glycosidase family protein [Ferruginibacter sp.]